METITPDQVQAVVDDVVGVQPFWAQLSLADRARYMRRAADVLVADMEEVAACSPASRASRSPRAT